MIVVLGFGVVIGLLLLLKFLEDYFQAVKSLFPEPAVVLDPHGNVVHGGGVKVVQLFTANSTGGDQTSLFQNAQVLHRTKAAHGELCAQFREGLPASLREGIE